MTDPNTPAPDNSGYGQPPAAPQPPQYNAPQPPQNAAPAPGAPVPGKTLGIVALIVAFFFNVIGLILGIVALVQSRKAGVKNLPAVWAIIVGAVFMVIGIIVTIVVVAGFASLAAICDGQSGTFVVDGVTYTCG